MPTTPNVFVKTKKTAHRGGFFVSAELLLGDAAVWLWPLPPVTPQHGVTGGAIRQFLVDFWLFYSDGSVIALKNLEFAGGDLLR